MLLFSGNGDANIALPYTVMGVIVLSVALIFFRIRLREINHEAIAKIRLLRLKPD